MHRKNEEKCANIVENEFDSLPNNLTNSIIIEDAEPVQRHGGAALVTEYEVAYREVVEIPSNW